MKITNEHHATSWDEYDFNVGTSFNADRAAEALKAAGYNVALSGATITISTGTFIGPHVAKARTIIENL